jgi:hypothetical protein
MGELKNAMKAKQCDPVKVQHHLARMESTSSDIMPVFGIDEIEQIADSIEGVMGL